MTSDVKRDFYTIGFICFVAFIIGLIGGSFDAMIMIALPLYVLLRYLQSKELL